MLFRSVSQSRYHSHYIDRISDNSTVDTRLQATTLNGGSINALVDPSSKYFTLKPGDNMLEFFTDAGTGYAEVTWLGAYGGI